jgi:16S rRNA (cytosine967-C5)-methyltransferase
MSKSPRQIAIEALGDRQGNVTDHLDRLLDEHDFSARDRGLARELTLGAARRRGTLRAVIRAFLRRPKNYLQRPVAEIIETAAYQLLMLDRVPDFAAVDEAVDLARITGHKRQAGFVNGLLRSLGRAIEQRSDGPPPRTRDVVPVHSGRYVKLDREVLPDPDESPAEHLAAAWSLPQELAGRWTSRYGIERAWQLGAHGAERPPLIVRVNRALTTVEKLSEQLKALGVEALPHANGRSLVLSGVQDVTALEAFRVGLIQPQDPTATAVLDQAESIIRPGTAVLDLCAAPGTKTTHLAELMAGEGRIVAADVNDAKLERIRENCRRMHVDIVEPMLAPQVGGLEPESFDAALVDVPCSNTGVLARRVEARWRFSETDIPELADTQEMLLVMAAAFVRPGGHVIYSTCSIEPEENSAVVQAAAGRAKLRLLREAAVLPAGSEADPTAWQDGGYRAVFRKS